MKKILTAAAFLLLSLTTFAQDGRSIYKKYSESKGVSAVYISPAMFKLMGSIPEIEYGETDFDITPAIQSLKGVYILESENREINRNLKNDVGRFVDNGKFELLMEVREDDEITSIYGIPKQDDFTCLVLLSYEPDECSFICIEGLISKEMLSTLMTLN